MTGITRLVGSFTSTFRMTACAEPIPSAVEDGADLADAGLFHVLDQGLEPTLGLVDRFWRAVVHAQVAFKERPNQPAPYRAVVVRLVANFLRTGVSAVIARIGFGQRPQPE